MCDILTITLGVIPNILYSYPEWCDIHMASNNDFSVNIDYDKLCANPPHEADLFDLGLAWFVCCIVAYMHTVGGETASIYKGLSFNDITDYSVLLPNNVMLAPHYHDYNKLAVFLFNQAMSGQKRRPMSYGGVQIKQKQSGGNERRRRLFNEAMFEKACLATGPLLRNYNETGSQKQPLKSNEQSGALDLSNYKNEMSQDFVLLRVKELERAVQEKKNSKINSYAVEAQNRTQITVGAGGNKREYKIYVEKETKRKYVRGLVKNTKWYLDEHRGSYKWSSDAKSQIVLKAKNKRY